MYENIILSFKWHFTCWPPAPMPTQTRSKATKNKNVECLIFCSGGYRPLKKKFKILFKLKVALQKSVTCMAVLGSKGPHKVYNVP